MEITVEKVNAASVQEKPGLNALKAVRAAVYARVSTEQELQLHSLDEQMKSFKAKIDKTPGWVLVNVYSDEGISGTSVKKRKAFLQMIADCEAGKIDYILTKSISRFARNTIECLSYVRHLQHIGVQLYFEKEGIDTATAVSEMILTIMAAFAQEESRSLSENLKWGIRKRFTEGKSRWTPVYGYRKNGLGEIVIEPEEAAVVRMIFEKYQHGMSIPDILDELARLNIPTARGRQNWTKTAVKYLLQNEKYIGDMRLQKWVSVDHISHKSVPNNSLEIPSFYVKNHHAPIIDRHTYWQVQRIMELKSPHGEYSRYPYWDTRFVCPLCGKQMIPKAIKSTGYNRIIGCFGDAGCHGYAVKVRQVDAGLLEAYNALTRNGKEGIKKECPRLDSVQYYWLDDLVEQVEFLEDALKVRWKCGLDSAVKFRSENAPTPTHVAEIYRNYAERQQRKKALAQGNGAEKQRGADAT